MSLSAVLLGIEQVTSTGIDAYSKIQSAKYQYGPLGPVATQAVLQRNANAATSQKTALPSGPVLAVAILAVLALIVFALRGRQ